MALMLMMTMQGLQAQDKNDFGYDLSVEGETSIVKGWKLNLEGAIRTQDDAKQVERLTLGASVSRKFFQTKDKKLSLKAAVGAEFIWNKRLSEKEYKYFEANDEFVEDNYVKVGDLKGWNITERHWRNRRGANAAITANYSPDKRWTFTLKETLQHSHYYSADPGRVRYRIDDYHYALNTDSTLDLNNSLYSPYLYSDSYVNDTTLDAEGNVKGRSINQDTDHKSHKDRMVLRSKLTVSYDIKGFPVDVFAAVDYGCGLNYNTHKWKITAGYDYKINKTNKLTLFYRYNTENDDDEADGHLVGLGYKIDF